MARPASPELNAGRELAALGAVICLPGALAAPLAAPLRGWPLDCIACNPLREGELPPGAMMLGAALRTLPPESALLDSARLEDPLETAGPRLMLGATLRLLLGATLRLILGATLRPLETAGVLRDILGMLREAEIPGLARITLPLLRMLGVLRMALPPLRMLGALRIEPPPLLRTLFPPPREPPPRWASASPQLISPIARAKAASLIEFHIIAPASLIRHYHGARDCRRCRATRAYCTRFAYIYFTHLFYGCSLTAAIENRIRISRFDPLPAACTLNPDP